MEDSKCAVKNCRKPPVASSPYCHYHLSKMARLVTVIGGAIVGVALVIVTLLKFFFGGRKA